MSDSQPSIQSQRDKRENRRRDGQEDTRETAAEN